MDQQTDQQTHCSVLWQATNGSGAAVAGGTPPVLPDAGDSPQAPALEEEDDDMPHFEQQQQNPTGAGMAGGAPLQGEVRLVLSSNLHMVMEGFPACGPLQACHGYVYIMSIHTYGTVEGSSVVSEPAYGPWGYGAPVSSLSSRLFGGRWMNLGVMISKPLEVE